MYRVRDDQPLMIDLNLVGYSFTTALADALERTFVESEQFVAAQQFKTAEQAYEKLSAGLFSESGSYVNHRTEHRR